MVLNPSQLVCQGEVKFLTGLFQVHLGRIYNTTRLIQAAGNILLTSEFRKDFLVTKREKEIPLKRST